MKNDGFTEEQVVRMLEAFRSSRGFWVFCGCSGGIPTEIQTICRDTSEELGL